ncbi:MAG: DUF3829 domain-containing protein [Polyangiaceae bacterium]
MNASHRLRPSRLISGVLPLLTVAATTVAIGCHDEPQQTPSTALTPTALSSTDPHAGMNRQVDIPPLVQKTNLATLCAYGTLSLRNARAAYLGSLGNSEPGPDKIPDFGQTPSPGTNAAPPASGSAAPSSAPSSAPSAKAPPKATPAKSAAASAPPASASPAASAAPSSTAVAKSTEGTPPVSGKAIPERRLVGVRYQQYTKYCQLLASTKEPASPQLDALMPEYAPLVTELAKDLTEASMYYQQATYKSDDFAKGRELHKKILDAFGKLDAIQVKVLAALADLESTQPIDRSAWTESQKLSNAFNTAAFGYFLHVNGPTLDWKAAKEDLTKIDAALKAFSDYKAQKDDAGNDHARDPFVQRCLANAEQFAQLAHTMYDEGKDQNRVVPAQGIALTNFVDRLISNDSAAMGLSFGVGPQSFTDKGRLRMPGGRPGSPMRARPPMNP